MNRLAGSAEGNGSTPSVAEKECGPVTEHVTGIYI